MRSSLGVPFQWVVLATSRACGGAKGSVFKSQARTRAGDANEMRSAVNPPSFPVRAPYAAMKVGNELVWSGQDTNTGRVTARAAYLARAVVRARATVGHETPSSAAAWLTAWTSPDRAGTTFLHRVVNRARGGPVQSGVLLWVGTVMPGPGFGCETRRDQLRRRFPTASGLPRRGR